METIAIAILVAVILGFSAPFITIVLITAMIRTMTGAKKTKKTPEERFAVPTDS